MALTAFQTDAFQRTAFQAPIVIAESISSTATILSGLADTCQKLEYLASELLGVSSISDAVSMSESILVEVVSIGDVVTPSIHEENPQATVVATSSSQSVVAMAETAMATIKSASSVTAIKEIVESMLVTAQVVASATDRVVNYLVENVYSLAHAEGTSTDRLQAKETVLSMVAAGSSTIEIAEYIDQITSAIESQSSAFDKLIIPHGGIVFTLRTRPRLQSTVFVLRPINKIFSRSKCSL